MKFLAFFALFLITYTAYTQHIDDTSPNTYKFRYKSETFKGTRLEITEQLRVLKDDSKFASIPEEIRIELNSIFKTLKSQPIPKIYKKHAIVFLDFLYNYEDFVEVYNNALYEVILKLKKDMRYIDFKFERQFTRSKIALDRTKKENKNNEKEITRLEKELYDNQIKLISHRWMKKKFEKYYGFDVVKNPDDLILEFKQLEAMAALKLFQKEKIKEINIYLENQIIDFFYKKSIPEINPEILDLQYITKI